MFFIYVILKYGKSERIVCENKDSRMQISLDSVTYAVV